MAAVRADEDVRVVVGLPAPSGPCPVAIDSVAATNVARQIVDDDAVGGPDGRAGPPGDHMDHPYPGRGVAARSGRGRGGWR